MYLQSPPSVMKKLESNYIMTCGIDQKKAFSCNVWSGVSLMLKISSMLIAIENAHCDEKEYVKNVSIINCKPSYNILA